MPILAILGLIFVTLKLTGYIAWSWWWVTAPFWGMAAFPVVVLVCALVVAAVVLVCALVVAAVAHFCEKKSR